MKAGKYGGTIAEKAGPIRKAAPISKAKPLVYKGLQKQIAEPVKTDRGDFKIKG